VNRMTFSVARRRCVAVVLACALCLLGARTQLVYAADAPTTVVQQTVDAVIAVLAEKNLSVEQRRHKVEDIVYAHFDFETLSRLVLARNWKDLNPDQQKAFVEEFKRHLSVTYGKNVENYNNEKAVVIGDRGESRDDWTVKTKVIRPNADAILMDYRLRKEGDDWRVIDVTIEGVSLVANFRSQFQEIISRDGVAKLIDLLREKNAKGESLKS